MTFPHDWREWRSDWDFWVHGAPLTCTTRPDDLPAEKNFMADEVLGYYRLPDGRVVELSEGYVPAPLGPDRFVGYTFAPHPDGGSGIVHTFAELEQTLGLRAEGVNECGTCGTDLEWDAGERMLFCPNTWEHG